VLRTVITLLALVVVTATLRADVKSDCQQASSAPKDIDARIKACTELLRQNPANAAVYHNRGIAFVRRKNSGDGARAVADFNMAIALEPRSITYLARGSLFLSGGGWKAAIADFTMAIALDPQSAIAYRSRGEAHKNAGDAELEQSQRSAVAACAAEKRFADCQSVNDSMLADYVKAMEPAIADYTKALELAPNDVHTYWLRGEAARAKKDDDLMIADHTKVLEINPQYQGDWIHVGLGVAYVAKRDFDRAIDHYTKALEIWPKAQTYRLRAETYLKASRPAEGLPDVERALALRADDPSALTTRGEILEALGRTDEAITDYRKVAAKHPRSIAMEHLKRLSATP
jgi:tetratricopeptide (TPR) repeat protein